VSRSSNGAAETISVPTKGTSAHLGAMMYLAVLAYPLRKERNQRDRLIEHMKLWLAKVAVKHNSTLRAKMSPKLTLTRLRKHEQMLLTDLAFERVTKRLRAGEIAFRQWASGQQVGRAVLNIRNSSTASVYRELDRNSGEHGENDFRKRTWLAAMPVLHLAMVYPRDKGGFKDTFDLVHKPDWLPNTLKLAEAYRLALGEKIPAFKPQNSISLIPSK
jgi:hypothetical protein